MTSIPKNTNPKKFNLGELSEAQYRQYFEHRLANANAKGLQRSGHGYMARCAFHHDEHPSLSLNCEAGTWFCHAGCGGGGILAFEQKFSACDRDTALRNISDIVGVTIATGKYEEPEAVYSYTDAFDKESFQVVRRKKDKDGKKRFSQRHRGKDGKWIYNIKGCEKVLYHLRDVARAANIVVCEGEKDCDNGTAAALREGITDVAFTTNPGGAGKWLKRYSEPFAGKQVAIIADNDDTGRAHAEQVAIVSYKFTRQIKVVNNLPGVPEKGDLSDYLEEHTVADLQQFIFNDVPEWKPPEDADSQVILQLALTDLGNAERLVARHGQDLHFDCTQGKWVIWDGSRFRPDITGEIERKCHDTVRHIHEEAARDHLLWAEKEAILRHAKASESGGKLSAMERVGRSLDGVPVITEDLDKDAYLLNCRNGTIDLKTGELCPHTRDDLITKKINVDYDPDAKCPKLEKFLDRVMDGNKEMIAFLQRAVGYSLTADTSEHAIFIMHGAGSNGKGTFIETILKVLGEYGCASDSSLLLAKHGDAGIRNDIARLTGRRLVSTSETEAGRRLSEAVVKQLVSGDTITARFLYQEFFDFPPTFKVWLSTNHLPRIKGTDHAIWRRIKLIPFRVTISEKEVDRELPEKLLKELGGILAWAVKGCIAWRSKGLAEPDEVCKATKAYRVEQDFFSDFLYECCKKADSQTQTASTELQKAYTEWCEANGYKREANPRVLWSQLTDRGFPPHRDEGSRYRLGIRLRSSGEQPDDFTVITVSNSSKSKENTVDNTLTVDNDGHCQATVRSKSNPKNDLQAADSDDSETGGSAGAASKKAYRRMSGFEVVRLAEDAGAVLHLNGDKELRWDFDHAKAGTNVDDLINLLFKHDAEVRRVLRQRQKRMRS